MDGLCCPKWQFQTVYAFACLSTVLYQQKHTMSGLTDGNFSEPDNEHQMICRCWVAAIRGSEVNHCCWPSMPLLWFMWVIKVQWSR